MSGLSVYLLLRPLISFQRRVGLVRKLTFSSVCFQRVVCSVLMSASISVLSSCIRAIVLGERGRRVCILCLMWRLKVGL